MKILLQNIQVISPGSAHHLKEKDILIEGDKIISVESAGKLKANDAKVINGKNLFVSPGWFDLHVNFAEPGFENKEDIESGCRAALQGGFSGVLVMPTTNPPVSGRPAVEYISKRSNGSPLNVYVAGTISHKLQGKDLSEMYDMYLAGSRVFTDDKHVVQDASLMLRALQYSHNFGGRIFSFAEDESLAANAQVNEGITSTTIGLKGIPDIAEEIIISRDLMLAKYANTPIHFSTVTSKRSVELIRKAKKSGMKVTADVSATHLYLDETSLEKFDSVYKLKPPLRSKEDKEALIEGLRDGTIDCICSDHVPQDIESKKKEFELADYGASGIETAFAVARTATMNKLSIPELVAKFTTHPRMCAGLKTGMIDEGHAAELTIFDPDKKWKVSDAQILSKSKNNPFIGSELTGKPVAVVSRGTYVECIP